MTDVHSKEQRSYNMSRIKGKNTKPEISIRTKLFKKGFRGYRIHSKLPGKPDLVFSRHKLAIFLDGCYWHKCPKCFTVPGTRTKWWLNKIEGNVQRDKEVNKMLRKKKWKVLRFWEHDVRKNPDRIVNKIEDQIRQRRYDGI